MFPTGLFAFYCTNRILDRYKTRNRNKKQEILVGTTCKQLQQPHHKRVGCRREFFHSGKQAAKMQCHTTTAPYSTSNNNTRLLGPLSSQETPVKVTRRSIHQESYPTQRERSVASRQDSMMFRTGLFAFYCTYRTMRRPLIQNHNKKQENTEGRVRNQLQQHHCNVMLEGDVAVYHVRVLIFLSFWDLKIP